MDGMERRMKAHNQPDEPTSEERCAVCNVLLRDHADGFRSTAASDINGVPVCLECRPALQDRCQREAARPAMAGGDLNPIYDLLSEIRRDTHATRKWVVVLGVLAIIGIVLGMIVALKG